jgi:phosphomannomutase
MNNIVLFDVDGTLTDARAGISVKMLKALRELCRYSEIGFLTGSGLEYIKEQLWPALNDPIIRQNCHLLPCNGTEYIITEGSEEPIFNYISKASMTEEIGDGSMRELLKLLCELQARVVSEYTIPLTGNFIQNRGSMVNWCPIGRSAKGDTREAFLLLDKKLGIRDKYFDILSEEIEARKIGLTLKLGGDTSFDIYPNGWDKTYALRHFNGDDWSFWFVGDRCYPMGNDYEIFELLKPSGRAFETGGPEETIELIDFYILRDML